MYYGIDDRVRYCIAGKRVVLLDIERNRFFGLPKNAEAAFLRMIDQNGELTGTELGDLGFLRERYYIVERDYPIPVARGLMADTPTANYRNSATGNNPFSAKLAAIGWQIYAAATLRFRRFSSLVDNVQRTARGQSPGFEDSAANEKRVVEEAVAAFASVDFLFGRTNRCLVRSVAMVLMLRAKGIPVHLVFGVRTEPFAAHCWAQLESVVLNDQFDHVRTFTPILCVG